MLAYKYFSWVGALGGLWEAFLLNQPGCLLLRGVFLLFICLMRYFNNRSIVCLKLNTFGSIFSAPVFGRECFAQCRKDSS